LDFAARAGALFDVFALLFLFAMVRLVREISLIRPIMPGCRRVAWQRSR
jgi:hypothetical protein